MPLMRIEFIQNGLLEYTVLCSVLAKLPIEHIKTLIYCWVAWDLDGVHVMSPLLDSIHPYPQHWSPWLRGALVGIAQLPFLFRSARVIYQSCRVILSIHLIPSVIVKIYVSTIAWLWCLVVWSNTSLAVIVKCTF